MLPDRGSCVIALRIYESTRKKIHRFGSRPQAQGISFPAVATYYQEPIALVKGEGEYVWDDQGNRYLDAFGGVLTVSVGHANPKGQRAIIEQVKKISTPRRCTPTSTSRTSPKSSPRSRPAI